MRKIPEPLDLQAISRACDRVLAYMRTHRLDEETIAAMAQLCTFLSRVKDDIEWIEDLMRLMKDNRKNDNSYDAQQHR